MRRKVTDYFLYRWRFIVGYSVFGLAFAGLLVVAGLYIPGGLSQAETNSVVAAHAFSLKSFDPSLIVNLPFHLLQRASMHIFGISAFSIKLPSLILGALSGLGMLLLLQTWFRRNVAVLASVLIITTGQFLFIAQNGTPAVSSIFLSVWLLVAATMVSRAHHYVGAWKITLLSLAALSLYTPLSLYILLALGSAVVLHPHLRYLVRQALKARLKVTIAIVAGIIVIAPLVYAIVLHPPTLNVLLGIPSEKVAVGAHIMQVFRQYFDFLSPSSSTIMTPIYSVGSMILIFLGILRLLTTNYTARSYIISAWAILLIPILIINPANTSIAFVPAVLLLAMGVQTLLSSWYQLFPRNPYARLAGLIPLVILVGGLLVSGVDRYMYGYLYDPLTADNFSNDLSLANHQLANKQPAQIVVTPDELPFYQVVADYHPGVTASTTVVPTATTTIVSRAASQTTKHGTPWRIVTDGTTQNANRFYIYKTDQK
jgi:hypothetical protein